MNTLYLDGGKPPWPVGVRGVHWDATFWHHSWLKDANMQRERSHLLAKMGICWVTLLSDGTSVLEEFVDIEDGKEKPVVQWFLDRQVVPIVRGSGKMNHPFACNVGGLVDAFAPYGMKPQIIPGNEFGDEREWVGHKVPHDWKERCLTRFKRATDDILRAGGLCLFPDPLSGWDWWFEGMQDMAPLFQQRLVGVAAHLYGVGRPPDYPMGPEIQKRQHITEAKWRAALDDLVDHPHFNSKTVEIINRCRDTWPNPATVYDDPTCFGAWEVIRASARKWLGCEIAMCMTEGGWTPKDNPDKDDRYPYTTPKAVANYTLDVFDATDHGLYAITPWVINGEPDWYTESWVGGAYMDVIDKDSGRPDGYEKPVVWALANTWIPGPPDPEPEPEPPVPPTDRWAAVLSRLDAIIGILEKRK
jgi:hypothetical protein